MSGTEPTQPIPPSGGGWGQPPPQGPPAGWGTPPPPGPPRRPNRLPWWRRAWVAGLIWGVIGFVIGAVAGGAGAQEQPPTTVTVTSIVTSIVPASTTTTTEPETTTTARATTTTTRRPTTTSPPTTRRRVTTTTRAPTRNCDPSYPDFCIPPPPPDLDCPDINGTDFTVQGADPHGFDADGDGVGCES
jgi:hypothetical protein